MEGIPYRLPGLAPTVVTGIRIGRGVLVVGVRPRKGRGRRCPERGRRRPRHDAPRGPGRWRALDPASARCFLEYKETFSPFGSSRASVEMIDQG